MVHNLQTLGLWACLISLLQERSERRCCGLCHLIALCLEGGDGFVNGLNAAPLAFLLGVFNYRPVHFILYGRVRIRIKQGLHAPFISNA
eukprot:13665_1